MVRSGRAKSLRDGRGRQTARRDDLAGGPADLAITAAMAAANAAIEAMVNVENAGGISEATTGAAHDEGRLRKTHLASCTTQR